MSQGRPQKYLSGGPKKKKIYVKNIKNFIFYKQYVQMLHYYKIYKNEEGHVPPAGGLDLSDYIR